MGTGCYYCIKKCKPCDYDSHVWGATEPDCEKCENEFWAGRRNKEESRNENNFCNL